MKRSCLLALAILPLAGCGRVADLKPAPGHNLPVKPAMAKVTPTAHDLLTKPSYAAPVRVDDLIRRSEPRQQDPFDLPPATGGAAPSLPGPANPQPSPPGVVSPGE